MKCKFCEKTVKYIKKGSMSNIGEARQLESLFSFKNQHIEANKVKNLKY